MVGNKMSLERAARELGAVVEGKLQQVGLFYRIFHRAKTERSIKIKIDTKGYKASGKRLQDLIGIRVNLYFLDDVDIVHHMLKERLDFVSETVDKPTETEFKPIRINIVCKLPSNIEREVQDTYIKSFPHIDATYEVQIRTVFSEGWHEVEHDLRYKRPEDWRDYPDLGRALNGLFATLETSDRALISILGDLARQHYKNKNWTAMLNSKFRMRLEDFILDDNIVAVLNSDSQFAKEIYRLERRSVLNCISANNIYFPLTASNLIYFINYAFLKNESLVHNTPSPLKSIFKVI